ncbi:phage scaffolding protein [Sporosarcina sp. USHLN248]|uniref:phage scaffolding protein n=1 Tax=Sporosarcina sp. USHLN248 TaxID=3081300 RepID=UPI00301A896F
MTKEQLMALGLTEEQATKVVEGFGTMIPKSRFDEVNDAKKQLESDLAARDTQLEDLKKAAGASEELKAQIQTLQDENKTAKEQYEAELKDLTMTNAIKLALNGKVHDEDLASGLIDKTKLVLGEDGKVVGLDEQLNSLKESKAFLFKSDEPQQPGFKGKIGSDGQGTPPSDNAPSLIDAISSHFSTLK